MNVLNKISIYISIMRLDHWFKNIFVLPGIFLAIYFYSVSISIDLLYRVVFGLLLICITSSANYTINEYLDSDTDKSHPIKSARPGARGLLEGKYVLIQYATLSIISLYFASMIGLEFLLLILLFLFMALLYNVKPARLKDTVYVDVLIESFNNPLRLLLGWYLVSEVTEMPPSSLLLSYWMGGTFLMTVKRLAEYRMINDEIKAALYRKSFSVYTETKLIISSFFYGITSSLFLGIFLIKYKIELILVFPMIAALFSWYLYIGLSDNKTAVYPEKLYTEKELLLILGIFIGSTLILLNIDIPFMNILLKRHFLS